MKPETEVKTTEEVREMIDSNPALARMVEKEGNLHWTDPETGQPYRMTMIEGEPVVEKIGFVPKGEESPKSALDFVSSFFRTQIFDPNASEGDDE